MSVMSTSTVIAPQLRDELRAIEGVTEETVGVLNSIPRWWAARAKAAGLTGEWLDVNFAVRAVAPAVLEPEKATLDPHLTSHELGEKYVQSLAGPTRSEHGRFYTPEALADHLWVMARKALKFGRDDTPLPGLVRDPAVGCGALLLPVLREHLRALDSADPAIVLAGLPNLIEGIDSDPWAVYIANLALAAECLPTLARASARLRRPIEPLVVEGDGLAAPEVPAILNIQNPPYGRISLSADQRKAFEESLFGHANLYGLFMANGAEHLESDGVLAALVPTGFTAGLYFHKLRGRLSVVSPLHSITFVENRSGVFSGVLQETCLAIFSKRRHAKVLVSRANGSFTSVASIPVPKTSDPWLMPREASDAEIAAAASKLPQRLSDTGWKVSTGPLVWNRRKADIGAVRGKNRARILWAADMKDGRVSLSASKKTQRFITLTKTSDESVMVLNNEAVLVQRTTAPEQTRRLVAAHLTFEDLDTLDGRVVVENHVNVLRPVSDSPSISPALLTRLLNTNTLDRVMRCISGTVAVSAYELSSIPLPDDETLASWESLDAEQLERSVASAYRLGSSR